MNFVLLISGKQGSGKSTLSKNLMVELGAVGVKVTMMKFADPLYAAHDGVYEALSKFGMPKSERPDKRLLQLLGTEWGRNTIGPDVWANLARHRAINAFGLFSASREIGDALHHVIIFDDCRFLNEFNAFNDLPNAKIRLEAPSEVRKDRTDVWRDDTNHPSEVGLDNVLPELWNETIDTSVLEPMTTSRVAMHLLQARGVW